ncbi:MAG: hypothetical protein HC945_01490 [Nitrosarchaeum sp.]|nr:hypothetical protein [Nitrosarchaeum sp.]
MAKGIIIGGKVGELIARQKTGERIELGELLIAEHDGHRNLLQAYDLIFSSQLSQQNLEMIGGMTLEQDTDFEFLEPHERTYTLAISRAWPTSQAGRQRRPRDSRPSSPNSETCSPAISH